MKLEWETYTYLLNIVVQIITTALGHTSQKNKLNAAIVGISAAAFTVAISLSLTGYQYFRRRIARNSGDGHDAAHQNWVGELIADTVALLATSVQLISSCVAYHQARQGKNEALVWLLLPPICALLLLCSKSCQPHPITPVN